MMTSPKEQWPTQISDYDILFTKVGWLVDKSNRPHGQKYPMTKMVKFVLGCFSKGKENFSLYMTVLTNLVVNKKTKSKIKFCRQSVSLYCETFWCSTKF